MTGSHRPPRIGERRLRLLLEMPVAALDPLGGRQWLWQAVGPVWARVEPVEPKPPRAGPALPAAPEFRITLAWQPGVTAGMRLVRGAQRYRIRAVLDPAGTRRHLVCLCREETG
ncbi:MAG: phage head closure protein [Beijerinckiaceae bacterium]|nr:phage head closure protein [Beijerinckiaceae bacterium]